RPVQSFMVISRYFHVIEQFRQCSFHFFNSPDTHFNSPHAHNLIFFRHSGAVPAVESADCIILCCLQCQPQSITVFKKHRFSSAVVCCLSIFHAVFIKSFLPVR